MAEPETTKAQYKFGVGVGIGLVVYFTALCLSFLIDERLFLPIAILGFVSGVIRPFVASWPEILSFAGGHFLIQWLLYSLTKVADWRVSILYALIGMATCLGGQYALSRKKA